MSVLATAWLASLLLGRVDAYTPLRVIVPLGLTLVAAAAVVLALADEARGKRVQGLAVAALVVALVPSFIWAYNGTRVAQNATFPDARPAASAAVGFGAGPGGLGGLRGGTTSTAEYDWLEKNSPGATWVLAASSSMQADTPIVDGYSVMAYGGFSGSDPSLTTAKLADLVATGKLRFVSRGRRLRRLRWGGGPGGFGGGSSAVTSAVSSACTPVSATNWGGSGTSGVYDCRGKADALAPPPDAGRWRPGRPDQLGSGCDSPSAVRGPGTLRKWKASLVRPGCTNQHSPVPPPWRMRSKASTTSDTSSSGMPASVRKGRMFSVMAVSAKPGQSAFTVMWSPWSAGPRERTRPTTACLFAA